MQASVVTLIKLYEVSTMPKRPLLLADVVHVISYFPGQKLLWYST